EALAAPLAVASQNALLYAEAAREISERKRAEESLRRTNESFSMAQRASASGVWDWDMQNNATFVSPEYRELYGFGPGDGVSWDHWIAAVHPEDRDRMIEASRRLRESGTEWNEEFRILHPTRGECWLAGHGRIDRDASGTPVRFTGINLDITDRKRLESELLQSLARLQEADRQKDAFLATLAHELRNPLAPIRNAVQVLRLKGHEGGHEVKWSGEIIDRQVANMARLLDDLLDVSRITSNKLEMRMQYVELASLVDG